MTIKSQVIKAKRIYVVLTLVLTLLSAWASAQEPSDAKPAKGQAKQVLIVYLSRTNNTKALAQMIYDQVGGKLVALELEKPYPEEYRITVEQVSRENATGFLPPLKTRIDSIEKYQVVFVGFPTWGMQLPPPIKSFLKQYDLADKTIIPFNTNAGYGIGSSFDEVKKLTPNSTVIEGFSTKGGVERDGTVFVMEGEKEKQTQVEVIKWLLKIQMLK